MSSPHDTNIGVIGAQALAKNTTLTILDLDGNNIKFKGNKLWIFVPEDGDNPSGYYEIKGSKEEINRLKKAARLTTENEIDNQITVGFGDNLNNLLIEPIKEVTAKRPCTP